MPEGLCQSEGVETARMGESRSFALPKRIVTQLISLDIQRARAGHDKSAAPA
jgi:hypothetical protein